MNAIAGGGNVSTRDGTGAGRPAKAADGRVLAGCVSAAFHLPGADFTLYDIRHEQPVGARNAASNFTSVLLLIFLQRTRVAGTDHLYMIVTARARGGSFSVASHHGRRN